MTEFDLRQMSVLESEAEDGFWGPQTAYIPAVVVEPHGCLDSQPRLRLLGPALIRGLEASL